jgi:hypothetical protein
MPIEEPYDLLIILAIPVPLAAGIASGLIVLNHLVTRGVNPLPRTMMRSLGLLAGGTCVVSNTATSVLWWWSWRYFEDPKGTPPDLDRTIDLGLLVGGIGLILTVCVSAIAVPLSMHARSPAHEADVGESQSR